MEGNRTTCLLIDIPPPLRQYLRLSHSGATKMKTLPPKKAIFSYISTLSVSQLQTSEEISKNLKTALRTPNKY
jgi:hypothetical protein